MEVNFIYTLDYDSYCARRMGSIDVCSHIYLGEGLILVVDPRLSHLSSEELRKLTLKLVTVLEQFDKAVDKTHE
ncbi:MAG: hypothetical protein IJ022_03065 [Burkholderiaceae bacterium]|nr:hypothetical protein [Burkholderiaceae bacterium]